MIFQYKENKTLISKIYFIYRTTFNILSITYIILKILAAMKIQTAVFIVQRLNSQKE